MLKLPSLNRFGAAQSGPSWHLLGQKSDGSLNIETVAKLILSFTREGFFASQHQSRS